MKPECVRYNCAVDAAMSVIEGRWKCTILCMLYKKGIMRFSELQKDIGDITSRILSKQLKELEADHMITRSIDSTGKLKVDYRLTAKGESIIPLLADLAEWGARNQCIQLITVSDTAPDSVRWRSGPHIQYSALQSIRRFDHGI